MRRTSLLAAVLALVLAVAAGTANATFSRGGSKADVGMWGSSSPSTLTPVKGSYSLVSYTVKNNGPDAAYGLDVHLTVPRPLKIEYARDYSAAQQCTVKGTYVACYLGNFKPEQLATIVIKVHPRGKHGTYRIHAHVYTQGVTDLNKANNQATVTVRVD